MFNHQPCNKQRLLPPYLIVGGVFLVIMVCLKMVGSLLTCCRNRNRLSMTEGGDRSALGICAVEMFCIGALVINIILLGLGAYYIMKDINSSIGRICPSQGDNNWWYLYYASVVAVLLQPLLYICSSMLMLCVCACNQ